MPTRRIKVVEAGHPVPDEAGLRAADDTLRLAAEATPDDLLLVLLTGGGSANWIAPVAGVSFAQKQQVNRALLRSGADNLFIPAADLTDVRRESGMNGKFVEKDGLLVVSWLLGGQEVSTGFRTRAAADRVPAR